MAEGPRLPVLQALSFAAALGKLAFHDFAGSFGRVTLQPIAHGQDVTVDLHTIGQVTEQHSFKIRSGALVDEGGLGGECTQPQPTLDRDERLLNVLSPSKDQPDVGFLMSSQSFTRATARSSLPPTASAWPRHAVSVRAWLC